MNTQIIEIYVVPGTHNGCKLHRAPARMLLSVCRRMRSSSAKLFLERTKLFDTVCARASSPGKFLHKQRTYARSYDALTA